MLVYIFIFALFAVICSNCTFFQEKNYLLMMYLSDQNLIYNSRERLFEINVFRIYFCVLVFQTNLFDYENKNTFTLLHLCNKLTHVLKFLWGISILKVLPFVSQWCSMGHTLRGWPSSIPAAYTSNSYSCYTCKWIFQQRMWNLTLLRCITSLSFDTYYM